MTLDRPAGVELGLLIRAVSSPASEARAAEELGFDFVAAGEHVSSAYPTVNALMCLTGAAAVTQRLGLMTAITLAPLYPPPLLAKMAAYLDSASDGRLELGLGVGGEFPNELLACGVPPAERGRRTSELIEVLQTLWSSDGPADFAGRYTAFEDITIDPRPGARQIPLWVSGRSDAAIKRAIAYETGWFPYMYSPRKLAASLDRFAELGDHRPRAGVLLWAAVHEDPAQARAMALRSLQHNFGRDFSDIVDSVCLVGTPARVTARLGEYLAAGASRVVLSLCAESESDVDAMRRLIAAEVIPAARA